MNKNFMYMDDEAVVALENGEYRNVKYTDNLKKILIKENLIEEIENKIQKTKEESIKFKKSAIKKEMAILLPFLACTLCPTLVYHILQQIPFVADYLQTLAIGYVTTGQLSLIIANAVLLPKGIIKTFENYKNYSMEVRRERARQSTIEGLEKVRTIELKRLNRLKLKKTNNNKASGLNFVKIGNKKIVKRVDRYAHLYYECGYNYNKYYRCYKKGKLKDVLDDNYNEFDCNLAEKFFEEKGPILVKKR